MTNGTPSIGPAIGGLLGIGVMALAAKGVIDIVKEQSQTDKAKKRKLHYTEKYEHTPRPQSQSNDRVQRGLDRMLGR